MMRKCFVGLISFLFLWPVVVLGQTTPQYHEVSQIGRPSIQALDWNPKRDLIAVATIHDIWLYDAQLKDVAQLDLASAVNLNQWESKDQMQPINVWRIGTVKWSPDGRWLTIKVSILTADYVWQPDVWQIWDWDGIKFTQVMADQFPFVSDIKWRPDASQFAVTYGDKIYLIDSASSRQLKIFQAVQVEWSSDSRYLAVVAPSALQIFDAHMLDLQANFLDSDSALHYAVWNDDNTKIAALGNNRLYVWDFITKKRLIDQFTLAQIANPEADQEKWARIPIGVIAWRPHHHELAVVHNNTEYGSLGKINILDVTNNRLLAPSADTVGLAEMQWTPDGNKLIFSLVGSFKSANALDMNAIDPKDQLIQLTSEWRYDFAKDHLIGYDHSSRAFYLMDPNLRTTLKTLGGFSSSIREVSWNVDGKHVVAASPDEIELWDVASAKMLANNTRHLGRYADLVGWNSGGEKLAIMSSNPASRFTDSCNSIRIWDAGQSTIRALTTANLHLVTAWGPINNELTMIEDNYVDQNCQRKSAMRIIDTDTREELFNKDNSSGVSLMRTPQGKSIPYHMDANRLSILDIKTGKTLQTIPVPDDLSALTWLADKNWLVLITFTHNEAQTYSSTFSVQDATTGEILFSLPDIQSFSLASDQTHIALIDTSGHLEIGSVTSVDNKITYNGLRKFTVPNTIYSSIWWNPQATSFATLSIVSPVPDGIQNAVLQIWDLQQLNTPQTIGSVLVGSEGSVENFAWHPDGKTFAVSFIGGLVKIWSRDD